MLGATCSLCCGCSVASTANLIASKSCVVALSGYRPKFEAATFVAGSVSAVLAFPGNWFNPSQPSDQQLAALLVGGTWAPASINVESHMQYTIPATANLALTDIGPSSLAGGGANVTFEAPSLFYNFRVIVTVSRIPFQGAVQLQGSKCYLSVLAEAVAWQPIARASYEFTDLNDSLIPAQLSEQIDPASELKIVVDDQPAAPAENGSGGSVRNGVVRVASPFYRGINLPTSATVPVYANNFFTRAVFDSDIRKDKTLKDEYATWAFGGDPLNRQEARARAATFNLSGAGRLAISGSLMNGNIAMVAEQLPAAGLAWGPFSPLPNDLEWGINPQFVRGSTRSSPFAKFSASPKSYETTKSTEKATMQVLLS